MFLHGKMLRYTYFIRMGQHEWQCELDLMENRQFLDKIDKIDNSSITALITNPIVRKTDNSWHELPPAEYAFCVYRRDIIVGNSENI